MVYYISTSKYAPMIQKVLTETGQVCVGNQVGEEIYLKKYVKENILSFEQIDIFLIDICALRDMDEEVMQSIESLRIMDYKIRFILLAPNKKEGDKFLRECFYAGIYDLVVTDEYLEMSRQLTLCITEGMRYKDALRFRDAVEEEEKPKTMAVQKILIGVAGSGPRMGSTHNSIVLANFLRQHHQMTAVLEMNKSQAFEKIQASQKAKLFEEGYFSLNGVDYYPSSDRERVTAAAGRLYNFLVLDFGSYEAADKVLFNTCDVRLVFTGSKPWEFDELEKVFQEQDEDVLARYHFCFLGTTNMQLRKEIIKQMKPLPNVWFPEYTEDPFESSVFPEGEEILKEYLKAGVIHRKKWFWERG